MSEHSIVCRRHRREIAMKLGGGFCVCKPPFDDCCLEPAASELQEMLRKKGHADDPLPREADDR
jgi:hypothetical protein